MLVASFLSSGAWFVVQLPPAPVAKVLQILTASLWLLALGVGVMARAPVDRRVWYGLGVVGAVVLASLLAGGSLFQVAVYDLFADMPVVQWALFPLVFAIAAGIATREVELRRGLSVVVVIGAVLAAVLAIQQVLTGAPRVFGSSAYSVIAFAPLVPVGLALAVGPAAKSVRISSGLAAAVVAVVLGALAGSTMGTLVAVFAVALGIAVVVPHVTTRRRAASTVRALLVAVAALMAAGLLVAQIPAVSGAVLGPERLVAFDNNTVMRWYLWEGAQAMVVERPLLGHGPSGYRLHAAEYLNPAVHELGPGALGDIGPTAYSPQSPHSVLWEIATRLGVIGVIAFALLLAAWASSLARKVRSGRSDSMLRLGLAAGFASSLFAMLTNPIVFPIGLFAPVVAGLAIAEFPASGEPETAPPAAWARRAMVAAAVVLACIGVWLFLGEWRVFSAPQDDPDTALEAYEAALAVTPANPTAQRLALEMRLLTAADDGAVRQAHLEVDEAPHYIKEFAPNLVSLAAYSLAQAERTGRVDVVWEQRLLAQAGEVLPPIPSLVAERLHAALVSQDPDAILAALPDAQQWGAGYALTEVYLQRAEAIVGPLE